LLLPLDVNGSSERLGLKFAGKLSSTQWPVKANLPSSTVRQREKLLDPAGGWVTTIVQISFLLSPVNRETCLKRRS